MNKKETTKQKHPGGRPSDYTQEIAVEICRRITEGESVRSISRDESMPSIATIYSWIGSKPEFLKQYEKAKEEQIETLADEMLEIADDARNDFVEKALKNGDIVIVGDSEMVNRSRLRVDTRKWIAERLKPKKYGLKSDINVGGQKDNPLINATIDIDSATNEDLINLLLKR